MSYCETACLLPACSNDAVSGLPAYTVPACPLGLNGEPAAEMDLPGVKSAPGVTRHSLPADTPGCPATAIPVTLSPSTATPATPARALCNHFISASCVVSFQRPSNAQVRALQPTRRPQ